MKSALRLITIGAVTVLYGTLPLLALDPSLEISQYAHTSWTIRQGFSVGNIYAIAQTSDGYLWLGTEFGLFRFDGVRSVLWEAPAGQHLPYKAVFRLLGARDGTLWIGTFSGLVTLSGGRLGPPPPALADQFVTSLFEDREGTVWVGSEENSFRSINSRLCGVRRGSVQCYGEDNSFGHGVEALYEDSLGNLWASAEKQAWRIKPGPPKPYATIPKSVTALSESDGGRLLVAEYGTGLMQLVRDKMQPYPIRSAANSSPLRGHDVNSNKLLRDRDGGLWIGTVERGLIHVHHGRTDRFTKADGLSGDIVLALFEDREGSVWVATTGGLDRFRELPVTTVSVKQGLSSDATQSVLAAEDGSVWVATHDGLTRWKDGQTRIFHKANGLLDDVLQSIFEDEHGRIWVPTANGVAYFKDGRFVAVTAAHDQEVHFIAGDKAGNMWFSESTTLLHFRDGHLAEQIPWSELRRVESASVLVSGHENELWLGFWHGGGVSLFKDSRIHRAYTVHDGLAEDPVEGLELDEDGTLWVATQTGLNRIKDGRITTLTSRNGLPCDTVFWSEKDDDGFSWLYTACGLVRIKPAELNAWIVDPNRRIEITVWDAADGVRLRSVAATAFGPRVTKAKDGKLWFLTGEGVQIVDPRHLVFNKVPPPVLIEQIVADRKIYWQNITGTPATSLHLPPRIHDLQIDYTALSMVAPEKVHFKYKLENQDQNWREVVNDRDVQYSNLRPGHYRFRVIASNNSGVWNEQGDTLEFSIAPAYYQSFWFRTLCVIAFLGLLWAAYLWRVRQLHHDFDMTLEARVGERTRIARDLHDTLLQSFHGLLLRFQTVSVLLPERPIEAKEKLDSAIDQAAGAITEGRDAVQGLRASTVQGNDLALAIRTVGEELETDSSNHRPATFRVAVEGQARDFHPIVRDEIYKIAAEALHNAFHHAQAKQVEVEIRYDDDQFRLRVRDDGKGIDAAVLSSHGPEGHYGLRGMRERATLIKGKLVVWSEVGEGTEVELRVPGSAAYTTDRKPSWLLRKFAGKIKA